MTKNLVLTTFLVERMFKCQHFSTNLFDESSVCGLLIPEEDERGVDDPPEVDDDDENDN